MPARTADTAPGKANSPANSKRFELPALDFNFSSLTEGTDIPPPLPSPVREVPTPPHTPSADENKENKTASNGAEGRTANGASNGQKNDANETSTRPGSRSNTSILDEKKAKRGSGWFRRLRSGPEGTQSKRSSAVFEEAKKPAGPPPPMIPELSALESKIDLNSESNSFGGDLFKNIK